MGQPHCVRCIDSSAAGRNDVTHSRFVRVRFIACLQGNSFLSGKTTACPPIPVALFAFLAHLVGKLWIVAEFFLALALLATASWYSSALLGFASTLASCVGAPVPGQLGITECALLSCASIAHIHVSTVLSVALLRRARSLLWVILGAAFYIAIRLTTQSMRAHASPASSI
jgi:hypothetical protein